MLRNRLSHLAMAASILIVGMALALIAQPPPATYAVGWSAPRQLTPIELRDARTILLAPDQTFHLVWANPEKEVSQIFAGRLSLQGEWQEAPQRISRAGVRAFSPQMAVFADGSSIIAFIEKSEQSGIMVLHERRLLQPIVAAAGDMRQLVVGGENVKNYWLLWSENREGAPAIYRNYQTLSTLVYKAGEVQRLSVQGASASQPFVRLAAGVLHQFYFSDDNRFLDLRYEPIVAGQGSQVGAPLREPQILSRRGIANNVSVYPIQVIADNQGQIYLLESLGNVRLTRFDASGAKLDSAPILLERARTAGAVDAKIVGDTLWLGWSELRRGRAAQIFVRPFTLDGKPKAAETRLTYTSSGAFQPTWFMDPRGAQHLFWVENLNDLEAALFYANTAQPQTPSLGQRLGFGGETPVSNLLFTVAAAFMYALLLLMGDSGRVLLIAILLVVAFRGWPQRWAQRRTVGLCVLLVVAELVLVAPAQVLLGQAPISFNLFTPWVFFITALALTLGLVWLWRSEMSDLLRWPALPFVWGCVYYWLNALILLREGYAL